MSTDRIKLIPITEADQEFLLELRSNKKICDTIIYEPKNIEQQLQWFKNINNAEYFCIWAILKPPPEDSPVRVGFIGLFDIHNVHRRAKWTMRIHPNFWRRGYARESMKLLFNYAFNHLNLNKVTGDCFAHNEAEVNNLRTAGFTEEGVWKEHYFHQGQYRDAINFSMTKTMYENNSCLKL